MSHTWAAAPSSCLPWWAPPRHHLVDQQHQRGDVRGGDQQDQPEREQPQCLGLAGHPARVGDDQRDEERDLEADDDPAGRHDEGVRQQDVEGDRGDHGGGRGEPWLPRLGPRCF